MKNAVQITFDECFRTFPRLRSPSDLTEFWQRAILELKKVPVDARTKLQLTKSLGWETRTEVNLQSFGGERLQGLLSLPRTRGRVPAVIYFHDYREEPSIIKELTEQGIGVLSLGMRGNGGLKSEDHTGERIVHPDEPSPFYRLGLNRVEESFPFLCYLDAVRCVDFIRLQKGIDSGRIALLGKGFGAAMALFVASQRKDQIGLALECPSFSWLDGFLQDSESVIASDVRRLMGEMPAGKRQKIKKNLDYLDVLNWAEIIRAPVMMAIYLDDRLNPPRSGFALFNHLKQEKEMELFPNISADPDGQLMRQKTVQFLLRLCKD